MMLKPVRRRKAEHDDDLREVVDALELLAERRRNLAADQQNAEGGPRHSGRLLGNLLVQRGHLVASELQSILEYQARSGKRLGEIAVELGFINDRVLAELLAEQLKLPVVDLARITIDRTVACAIPYWEARAMGAIPTRRDGDRIEVALSDPTNAEVLERLQQSLGSSLSLGVATPTAITAALDRVWGPTSG
jgi:hypothetical protein